ncbi:hypothetical protein EJV46_07675 [Roseococcus sp. SYP-B2431]|uniref:hypothetical protein n=1 Tax=Roseococcus sp. SYP-B2431 TaxID=2496640 RepID=UPI00103B7805|nr:hypothetical protein [Roseococcus sp. SYP-B2431]TCI00500.1 hypothetical protein EJV46_07675 [Roseococcus sp. SYP-B2431]
MRLLHQRRPGTTSLWLDERPRGLGLPVAGLAAVHLPAAAPSSTLVLGATRVTAPAAGWVLLGQAGPGAALRAEGMPLRLSGTLGEGPLPLACRIWDAGEPLIPESHWRAARILGEGATIALAGGAARPLLRLAAGASARVTLPPLPMSAPLDPVLAVLRGRKPLAELEGLTLTLRAAAGAEVVWEAVQLRPKSRANSA